MKLEKTASAHLKCIRKGFALITLFAATNLISAGGDSQAATPPGSPSGGNVESWFIGNWQCAGTLRSPAGEMTFQSSLRITADGNFEQTQRMANSNSGFTMWGTYKLEPRGGNRAIVSYTYLGTTVQGAPLPTTPEKVLFSMPDPNTTENVDNDIRCQRA